jgi:hypothetical protein
MMIDDDVVWFLAGWEIMVGEWIGCWMLYVVVRYILVVIEARCFFASTCILNNTMTKYLCKIYLSISSNNFVK